MNSVKIGLALCLLAIPGITAAQQKTSEINLADSTGMPGDNFSLEGALGLFKESKSVEDFEKKLNDRDNVVNNIDLNGDGKTDYVRVVADRKNNTHIFILQAPINKTESQDIAVITLEKSGDRSAFVQIAGNEDVYGEEKIFEPKEEGEPGDGGVQRKGPSAFSHGIPFIYFNVWFWPCVQYVYAPVYDPWISPWYWGYYPVWWSPWPPYPWRYHYMHCHHYHDYYYPAYYHRSEYGPAIYAPRRTSSSDVNHRYEVNRKNYQAQMVSRPRPSAQNAQSKPGSVGGQVKPKIKPGTLPTKNPSKPQPVQQSKPKTKPQSKPQPVQQSKPQSKPHPAQHSKPQSSPGYQQPQSQPQSRPESKPAHEQPTQVKPGTSHPSQPSTPPPASRPPQGQSRPPKGAEK